jgi:D-3-phosphoglycerate dehydrogenase
LKVLVTDPIDSVCPELLTKAGFEVDIRTGGPTEWTPELGQYDGWIIRSGTSIDSEALNKATSLKVIGRAGVGVDNVDLEEATRRGVLVLNAPDGNTISTAEHTCAMILSLARRIPDAHGSVRSGKWERKAFKGTELYEKTLGVIGLGKIGREVASRMQSFGMKVVGSDPVVTPSAAERLGIELLPFGELLEVSDVITFHVPLVDATANMLNRETLKRCRDGVRIINCARGGLLDEEAILEGLESGKIAGVGLDVYRQEPPTADERTLLDHPGVVTTPHIAASTNEAQERVAQQVTEQLVRALSGEPVVTAVNSMAIRLAAQPEIRPYMDLAERLGSLVGQLIEGQPEVLKIRLYGDWLRQYDEILSVAAIKGFVSRWRSEPVNLINARVIADDAALMVEEQRRPADHNFKNLLEIVAVNKGNRTSAAGVVFGNKQPRVIRVNDFNFEIQPVGHILFYRNDDKPGMLASVGAVLAEAGINIGALALGRTERGSTAMTAISLDEPASDEILARISGLQGVHGIRSVQFR